MENHIRVDSNLHRKKLLNSIQDLCEQEKNQEKIEEMKDVAEQIEQLRQPPGCPNLTYNEMRDALIKIGFDFEKYTKVSTPPPRLALLESRLA